MNKQCSLNKAVLWSHFVTKIEQNNIIIITSYNIMYLTSGAQASYYDFVQIPQHNKSLYKKLFISFLFLFFCLYSFVMRFEI